MTAGRKSNDADAALDPTIAAAARQLAQAEFAAESKWLPRYAPELNDIEPTWRDLKRHHLAHQTFKGPEDLDRAIHDAVATLNAERSRHPLGCQQTAA